MRNKEFSFDSEMDMVSAFGQLEETGHAAVAGMYSATEIEAIAAERLPID